MAIGTTSLGIDFRKDQMILCLLRKTWGKIQLVDCKVYPLSEGSKEAQQTYLVNCLTAFLSRQAIDKKRVFISIPREEVILRFLRLPLVTKENLRQVLAYEAPKYVPFDREEIYFDYQILQQEKEWLNLVVVFVKKKEVAAYLSLLQKVDLRPAAIQIPSLSALNLFFLHGGDKGNELAVLLDLNDQFYELNLIKAGEWRESFHRPLPDTEREEKIIATLRQGGWEEAELLKASFFIYGRDAGEKNLAFFRQSANLKEVSFPPLHHLEVDQGGLKPFHFYASLGLPLKGLAQPRMDLNLLPLEMRQKVRPMGKPLLFILLFLSLLLGLAWGWGVYDWKQKELETLRLEVKKRKPEAEAVEKIKKQREDLAREIVELEKIAAGEVSKIEILKELSRILPPAVWIFNLKQSGKEVEISGFADSASDLIPLLDKSPLFERVEFLAPVIKEKERRPGAEKEKERFKIKMRLEDRRGGP